MHVFAQGGFGEPERASALYRFAFKGFYQLIIF